MSIKTIKNYIDADVSYNFTPDLPRLRYYGSGIPVFLWDDLKDFKSLQFALGSLDLSACYESRFFQAITAQNYVPWYNMDESQGSYPAYCLEEFEDIDFLGLPEYTKGDPLPMKGKLVSVSLQALQELDCYYENNHIFERTLITVYPSQWNKQPMQAYTWLNNVDNLSTFDGKTQEYVLDENIDPTPFRTTSSNSEKFYEM